MNAIQCDQCHTFASNPEHNFRQFAGGPRRLPVGWVSMGAGNGDQPDDARGEFCSMRCAGLFLLAYQPTELTEAERMASRKLFGARDETGTLTT